jgi:hypothetical protein
MSARGNKKEGDRATEFQVDEQELKALQQRLSERKIEEKDWETLRSYLSLLLKLSQLFQYGRVKMRKVLRMLFGSRTEKEKKKKDPSDNPPPAIGENTAPAPGVEQRSEVPSSGESRSEEAKKGHGRRPSSDYHNAETKICPLCHNKPGDLCPACGKGRLRELPDEIVIRFTGNPPITCNKFACQKVRCDTCGQIYKADLPVYPKNLRTGIFRMDF